MTITSKLFIFGMAWAALAGWATAHAQAPSAAEPTVAPASAADPAAAVHVANGGKHVIVAVYASPPGRADWSDDMLGKTALKPGQDRTLKFRAKPAACKVDLFAMMDTGDTATRENVDVCAAQPTAGF